MRSERASQPAAGALLPVWRRRCSLSGARGSTSPYGVAGPGEGVLENRLADPRCFSITRPRSDSSSGCCSGGATRAGPRELHTGRAGTWDPVSPIVLADRLPTGGALFTAGRSRGQGDGDEYTGWTTAGGASALPEAGSTTCLTGRRADSGLRVGVVCDRGSGLPPTSSNGLIGVISGSSAATIAALEAYVADVAP